MGFNSIYRCLVEIFPQVDVRILKAVAIENSKDIDAAVEAVLSEVLPYMSKRSIVHSSAPCDQVSIGLPIKEAQQEDQSNQLGHHQWDSGTKTSSISGPASTTNSTFLNKASTDTSDANDGDNKVSGYVRSEEFTLLGKAGENIAKEGVGQTNTCYISGPACTDDSTCMHKASIGTLDANFVNNQISGCIGSDELILLGKASDNIIKEGVVQTNTWCISGPACILNKASIDTLDANYVNDQISECIGSDELILLGKASENMVGVNQISSAMSSGLMHEEAISLGKFQDTTISIGPEQTAHLIPTAFVQENHGANSCSNDWCYDRKDFNDTGADLSDMVNCGEGHRAEAHLNAIISEVESAASELVPSYAQEHASDASNVCLQSVQSEYGSVSSNTDCEKPGGFSASEKGDIEDESTLSTIFTRSDHSCRVDLLEEIIEDAKNNKKTLFLAVESVMNMMRDVELKEKEAEQAKEEAARGGVDILTKVEELKQILTHAKEANEMRAGEVYGEKAILATELRELQTRLLSLSEERDRFLSILDEMRETLQARLAAAEEMRKAAEEEKLEKEACARNALAEQEAIMEKVVQESKILEQEAEENSKLQEFLIDRGQIVDSLQGEISVICQDVILLKQKFDKRLPLSKSISSSQTSCMLASSGSSLKSVAPSLVSEQWETPKSSEKRSRTTSINSESPKGKLEKEKGELLEDGWDLFENEADL